jgi:hypothetical protein
MKKYPKHSIVRIHTGTLDIIKEFCKQAKIKPPEAIDLMVNYFIKQETNIERRMK